MRSTTEQGGSHALDTPIDQSSSVVLPRRAMVRQECWIDTHVLPDEPEAEIDVGAAALGQVSLEAFAGFDGASADLRFWGAAAGQDRARVDDRGKACRIGQCAEMSQNLRQAIVGKSGQPVATCHLEFGIFGAQLSKIAGEYLCPFQDPHPCAPIPGAVAKAGQLPRKGGSNDRCRESSRPEHVECLAIVFLFFVFFYLLLLLICCFCWYYCLCYFGVSFFHVLIIFVFIVWNINSWF